MLTSLTILLAVQAAQPQQAPPAEKPKLICREGEQELGSHIHTSRRCKTAEDWQQEDARRDQTPTTLRVVNSQGDGTQRPQRPPLP